MIAGTRHCLFRFLQNVNILEQEKQTCEHTIFKYRKNAFTKQKGEENISQYILSKNAKFSFTKFSR